MRRIIYEVRKEYTAKNISSVSNQGFNSFFCEKLKVKIKQRVGIVESFSEFNNKIREIADELKEPHDKTKIYGIMEQGIKKTMEKKRILLVVATDLELKVLTDIGKKNGAVICPITNIDFSYFDVRIGDNHIFIAKSQMGSSGAGGSGLTTQVAIDKLSPDIVIMGGIAFGVNKEKQKKGDILISDRILGI